MTIYLLRPAQSIYIVIPLVKSPGIELLLYHLKPTRWLGCCSCSQSAMYLELNFCHTKLVPFIVNQNHF